jgi:hypothetical protein
MMPQTLDAILSTGKRGQKILVAAIAAGFLLLPRNGRADIETEEKFETVFVTAGYSTALGAGIGLALIAFTPDPGDRMQRYIATGAATGFLAGSALGGYLVLRPDSDSMRPTEKLDPKKEALGPLPRSRAGLMLDWTIARF